MTDTDTRETRRIGAISAFVAMCLATAIAVCVVDAQTFQGRFATLLLNSACTLRTGSGTPEAAVTGVVCDVFLRTNGGDGTAIYAKVSGTGNTGWEALLTDSGTATLTNKSGNISQWTNDSSYITATTNVVRRVTGSLTDAQVKALPTTPVSILASPGAGFGYRVIQVQLICDCGGNAYTNINTTYASLQIDGNPSGVYHAQEIANDNSFTTPLAFLSDFLGGAGDRIVFLRGGYHLAIQGAASGAQLYIQGNDGTDVSAFENDAMGISVDNNGSGNFTGGNASNSLKYSILYTVEAM